MEISEKYFYNYAMSRTSFTQVLDRMLEIEETHSCYVFGLKRFALFKKVDIRKYFCSVFGNDVSQSNDDRSKHFILRVGQRGRTTCLS